MMDIIPENVNLSLFSTFSYHDNVWIVGPHLSCPELYDYCKNEAAALHRMFSRNFTKACIGQVNFVVDRDFEENEC